MMPDSDNTQTILRRKWLNGWNLFWLIAIPMSLIMVYEMSRTDMSVPPGVSHMIGFSVKFAVPFIYLVVAASALPVLYPAAFSSWLLRNRKYIGMCFAVAMAWQGAFIFLMSNFHRDYYFDEIFFLRDELEGSTGYIFLTAMVLTSFKFGRQFLSQQQWKVLHRCGIYFLWAYPFSVYWWNLSYYPDPQLIDHVFYWAGFIAFASRISAYGVKRQRALDSAGIGAAPIARLTGWAVVLLGVFWSAASLGLQQSTTAFLTAQAWSANLELWLPFWPFEPFLSLMAMALGTMMMTSRPTEVPQPA
ncbi:MAG: hypothetical protein AAFN50_14005 [Pseudomonadota bacterium]